MSLKRRTIRLAAESGAALEAARAMGAKTLTVQLHPLGSALQDAAVRHLAAELTATETTFPGTDLRLVFSLAGPG